LAEEFFGKFLSKNYRLNIIHAVQININKKVWTRLLGFNGT
jgi:hypothetical protein